MARSQGHPRDSSRRRFLQVTGGAIAATPFHALSLACRPGSSARVDREAHPHYGPLKPVEDRTTGLPLLLLPAGFTYHTFGWTGDPLNDGSPTPPSHDGMAAFAVAGSRIRLVRNHEVTCLGGPECGGAFAPEIAYDPAAGGGTTTLEVDAASAELLGAWPSLSGTLWNCAGGPTPWGSWLSCEETLDAPEPDNSLARPHGYIFEVPVDGPASAEPYRAMGRFRHEAVAVDPENDIVYETEDAGCESGFYRFIPTGAERLGAKGRLQMLGLESQPEADTRSGFPLRKWQDVVWRDIDEPDPKDLENNRVYTQGRNRGGARFARLEGAWYGDDCVYFVSTIGGAAEKGQVWEYDPRGDRLQLLFESPGASVLDMPDNVCLSPRGGLLLCEDGNGAEFIHVLTTDGQIFAFAKNNVTLAGERNDIIGDFTGSEFAGVTYSPDGQWLFFNIQCPGITFAVTGPWRDGGL